MVSGDSGVSSIWMEGRLILGGEKLESIALAFSTADGPLDELLVEEGLDRFCKSLNSCSEKSAYSFNCISFPVS